MLIPYADKSEKIIRSSVQVDDIMDPVSAVSEIIDKIDKCEILRIYRIPNYNNTDEMLE